MAVILAIYGFIDLVLLLAVSVINERVKPILHSVGISKDWKRLHNEENVIERTCRLEEPTMRIVKISSKGGVTIPARVAGATRAQEGHAYRLETGWSSPCTDPGPALSEEILAPPLALGILSPLRAKISTCRIDLRSKETMAKRDRLTTID